MQTYMSMYSEIEMSCRTAKADDVLGATTNTKDRTVTTAPWRRSSGICTSFLFVFCRPRGR